MKTTNKPLFSIIIPVYNVEKYLRACFDSVLKQTYSNWEIVCVNDGSTDNSDFIINLYANQCKKIKVINQKNSGPAHARNVGMDNASGDYILFLDSDDTLVEEAIETLTKKIISLKNEPDALVYGAWFYPDNEERNNWLHEFLNTSDHYYEKFSSDILFKEKGTHPFIWMNCIKRSFLNDNKLRINETLDLGEDQLFQFTYFPLTKGVAFLDKKLYVYNASRNDSLMSKYYSMPTMKIAKHLEQIKALFKNTTERKLGDYRYKLELIDWVIYFVVWDILKLNEEYYKKYFSNLLISTINDFHPIEEKEMAFLYSADLYKQLVECSEKDLDEQLNMKFDEIDTEMKYIDQLIEEIKHSKKYKLGKVFCKLFRK